MCAIQAASYTPPARITSVDAHVNGVVAVTAPAPVPPLIGPEYSATEVVAGTHTPGIRFAATDPSHSSADAVQLMSSAVAGSPKATAPVTDVVVPWVSPSRNTMNLPTCVYWPLRVPLPNVMLVSAGVYGVHAVNSARMFWYQLLRSVPLIFSPDTIWFGGFKNEPTAPLPIVPRQPGPTRRPGHRRY